jgi:prepilin-type N-terminal cleavage/methylation domain-containing protein
MRTQSPKKAFTLIELLVVISIIGLLISLLLPALQSSRTTAQMIQSGAQLRDLFIAQSRYISDNNQGVPWVKFPWSSVPNSPYYNTSPYGPGTFKYYQFPWSAMLWDTGYIEDWRAFWSPGRDLSMPYNAGGESLFTRLTTPAAGGITKRSAAAYGSAFSMSYWGMTGYGMVGVLAGSGVATVDGMYERPNITNLDKTRLGLSKTISLAEGWRTDDHTPAGPPSAGTYRIEPVRNSNEPTIYLYNYNNNVARSYWDGHVLVSESRSIGWDCTSRLSTYDGTPYGGRWTYGWHNGPTGYVSRAPWYTNTVTWGIED